MQDVYSYLVHYIQYIQRHTISLIPFSNHFTVWYYTVSIYYMLIQRNLCKEVAHRIIKNWFFREVVSE